MLNRGTHGVVIPYDVSISLSLNHTRTHTLSLTYDLIDVEQRYARRSDSVRRDGRGKLRQRQAMAPRNRPELRRSQ